MQRHVIAWAVIVSAAQPLAQRATGEEIKSRAMKALLADVAGDSRAVEVFWKRLRSHGTPLIEPSATPDHSLVTFILRAMPPSVVRLDSSLNALLMDGLLCDPQTIGRMARLGDTDVNYLSVEVRNDLRVPYHFKVGTEGVKTLDPLNPNVHLPETRFAESLLVLPKAPAQPWAEKQEQGHWREHLFHSRALNRDLSLWAYRPAGYENDAQRHALLIGLDATAFRQVLPASRVVDYLVARQRIPPTMVIAVPDLASVGDIGSYDPVVAFLADEVLPWARNEFRVTPAGSKVVVAGVSRGGLVAAYAAFKRPDVFQRVLSLSGSYYWRPPAHPEFEWLPSQLARESRRPIRLYLAAGLLETVVTPGNAGHYVLATNRHMRDILTARDYEHRHVEFSGGHNPVNWGDQLEPGLSYLLQGSTTDSASAMRPNEEMQRTAPGRMERRR